MKWNAVFKSLRIENIISSSSENELSIPTIEDYNDDSPSKIKWRHQAPRFFFPRHSIRSVLSNKSKVEIKRTESAKLLDLSEDQWNSWLYEKCFKANKNPSIASLIDKEKDILNLANYKINWWKNKFEKKKLYQSLN